MTVMDLAVKIHEASAPLEGVGVVGAVAAGGF